MMLYPSVNELKEKTDSRYTLVTLTAKRARDIIAGKPVLTAVESERAVSLAANEINEELITYKVPETKAEEPAEEAEAAEEELLVEADVAPAADAEEETAEETAEDEAAEPAEESEEE